MPSSKKKYIHEGWIHKWTNFIGSWRPRYFMLEPDCLSYSVEKDGVIKESFLLTHCKIRLCPDDPVRLDIEVVGTCLLCLRTDTPLEKHKWYVSFKRAQKLAFQSHQKRSALDQFRSSSTQDQESQNKTTQNVDTKTDLVTRLQESKSNGTELYKDSKERTISNIFVKTKSGREPKSSLSYILENTETFEHISSKILNELESTTDSESLKHLNTFRLILTDFCCSIKQLSEEEFQTVRHIDNKYYTTERQQEHSELNQENEKRENLLTERSGYSENQLYNDQFYECQELQKDTSKETAELSEPFEESDMSEDLMDQEKESKILEYSEYKENNGKEQEFTDSDKSETKSELNLESKVLEEKETEVKKQEESKEVQEEEKVELELNKIKLKEKYKQIDQSTIKRRTALPHTRLEHKVSVWSILKDFIGKDLSRIRMPIVFNEPTSNLQRSAEDFTYYKYLNEAALMEDPIERLANVTIFSITPYSSAVGRSYKPFNPLLGETYELTHTGYNFFAEQVAHHPPILAFHCFNDKFESSGSLNMVINFTGKAIEANLMGPFNVILKLPEGTERYNIQRCNMILHNLIFGKMWIEAVGYVIIRNVTGGDFSVMQYLKKGWFNKEIHKVRGLVFDKYGTQQYYISGIWSKHLFIEKVYSQTAKSKNKMLNPDGSLDFNKNRYKNEADAWDAFVNDIEWEYINVVPNTRREVWKPQERPPRSEDYYGFGYLTMQLNELTEDYDKEKGAQMPKTDSRYRPDQRMYEEGKLEQATEEKKRLEDKQRAVAKHRSDNHISYKPLWFTKVIDPATHQANWIYNGTYWQKKLEGTVDEGTPDIFS